MLKFLELLPARILNPAIYPFSVPAIASLTTLAFSPTRVTCFTGENGTGKSTLLEAIALSYGLSLEGGNRNFNFQPDHPTDTQPLARALRLGFSPARTGEGFFFRAETLWNLATEIDQRGLNQGYGGRSLHTRSHGEASITLLDHKFRRSGLFFLDEPEAALSPQRQLSFLVLIHDTLADYADAQFIISTHSPILLGYPEAQIFSFDDGDIHPIAYEQTSPLQITRRFTADRTAFLKTLLEDEP